MAQQKKPGSKPNPAPPADDGGEDGGEDGGDEQPLTRTEVVKLINGAVSGQLARKLGPAIEAGLAPVLQKLEQIGAPGKGEGEDDGEDEPGDGDEQPGKKSGKPGKPDPAVAKMQKQMDALKRQVEEQKTLREQEANARKNSLIENELTKALTELGVDKNRMRGALAVHKASAFVDDGGQVLFKVKRDGYDEDLEPAAALKEWGDTDEGKSYLAPTGAGGGAGARAPRSPGPARKPSPASPEAKAQKIQEAKQSLLTAVAGELAGGSISID